MKRTIAVILMLTFVLPLFCSAALADGGEADTPWTRLQARFDAGGAVTLDRDVVAGPEDSALTVPEGKTVTLKLNGFTIDRGLADGESARTRLRAPA